MVAMPEWAASIVLSWLATGPKNLSLDMQSQAIPWTVLYRFQRLWTKFWTRKPKESPRVSVSWQWEAPWLAWDTSSLCSGSQEFCHWYMRECLITFLYFLKIFVQVLFMYIFFVHECFVFMHPRRYIIRSHYKWLWDIMWLLGIEFWPLEE